MRIPSYVSDERGINYYTKRFCKSKIKGKYPNRKKYRIKGYKSCNSHLKKYMLEEKTALCNFYMKPHPLLHTGSCTVDGIKPGIATLEAMRGKASESSSPINQ